MSELEKKFGLQPLAPAQIAQNPAPPVQVKAHTSTPGVNEKQVDEDFETARQNILNVLSQVNDAIDMQTEIFKDKEDARSAEALNAMYKTVLDSASQLLDVHKKRKDIRKSDAVSDEKGPTYIQNAVFTGTAKELQDLIKKLKEEKQP